MMNWKKHVVRNGLIAAAAAVLVHYVLPDGWNSVSTFFRQATTASGAWAGSLVSVPVWLLGIAVALVATGIGVAALTAISRRRKREPAVAPSTMAEIFGIRWRWKYQEGDIRDIVSYCPICDGQVSPTEETRHGFLRLISYQCRCGKWRSKSFQCSQVAMLDRVQRLIQKQAQT